MEIRHKTKFAALDIFKVILSGILNGDTDSTIEAKNADGLLKITAYVKPDQIAICLGRQHLIKDSMVAVLRVVCRLNQQEDVYLRFENESLLEKEKVDGKAA